jgi:putative hemolysin
MKRKLIVGTILMGVLLAACTSVQPETEQQEVGMPNPASVFCEENGGTLEIREDATGGQYGVCIFSDGSECEEWAYFRDECSPGGAVEEPFEATVEQTVEQPAEPTNEIASDGWKVYRDEELGYEFHYPADATINMNDDAITSMTILGPMDKANNWPMIYFSHPSGRMDFRPPEGADLEQWLFDNNLYAAGSPDERMPDVQIAGVTAIHLRYESGSGQSYNNDKYYFIKNGQLYQIVILHTGNKEDWELYNHFLESIEFND